MTSSSPASRGRRHMLREDLAAGAVLRVMWFHKRILLSVTLIVGLASLPFFSSQKKIYRAEALIKTDNVKAKVINDQRKINENYNLAKEIETDIVYLTSPDFLKGVVYTLNLSKDPEFNPSLRSRITNGSNTSTAVLGAQDEVDDGKGQGLASVVAGLAKSLEIYHVGNSHVISVGVHSSDPRKAAHIANTIVSTYLSSQLRRIEGDANDAIVWLENRIEELKVDLPNLEREIVSYRKANGLASAKENDSVALQRAELASQLAVARSERSRTVVIRDSTKARMELSGALHFARSLGTPAMSELTSIEVSLVRRLSELSAEYGSRHPTMLELRRDLSSVRQRMEAEANRALSAQTSEVAVSLAREAEIEAQLDRLKGETTENQSASIELRDLERSAAVDRDLLETYLARHRVLLEQAQIFEAGAEIMSPAAIPTRHHYPKPFLYSFILAMSGFCLTSLCIFVGDRFISDFGFKTMDELKDFGLEPLGVVPDLSQRQSKGCPIEDYVLTNPQSAQAEAFQRIRTQLYQLDRQDAGAAQSIMVTSSLPLEGKTATSIALARQAAAAGFRTLLIDADFRLPRVHDVLNIELREGLSDLLIAHDSPIEVIVKDPLTSLHVLSAGLQRYNPPDLFSTERMGVLMYMFGQAYDFVIVDTPPIGAVSDCLSIGRHASQCVYVARWRSTDRSVVLSDTQKLEDAGLKIAGVILSRTKVDGQQKYGQADFGQYYGHYQDRQVSEAA